MSTPLHSRLQRTIQSLQTNIQSLSNATSGTLGTITTQISSAERMCKEIEEMANREMNIEKRRERKIEAQDLHRQVKDIKTEFQDWKTQKADTERSTLLRIPANQSAAPYEVRPPQPQISEQQFLSKTENAVDDFIAQGRGFLESMQQQRTMLKGAHRKMLDVGNTLGLSNGTMRWVERRMSEDTYIFYGGAAVVLITLYLVYRWVKG